MIYGSVCSGIEAASCAWEPLGWRAAWVSEIEPFASRVLKHRYPNVPNLGDFTTIGAERGPVDLLVGGTPCQSFSVAGLRGGLEDDRGNLALEFLRLAARVRAEWVVWENVPGVLSSGGGRDFGSILGGLAELGYGFAYRVLDAQYFGLAQRRKRVFVVARLGDWRGPAAVLFEHASLRGDPAPRRASREDVAGTLGGGSGVRGWADDFDRAGAFIPQVSPALKARDFKGPSSDGDGDGAPLIAQIAFHSTQDPISGPIAPCLGAGSSAGAGSLAALQGASVRRLTPRECERLQGFPDGWTDIPGAKDGPRYRALGNSMAVPCMAWLGRRIDMVNSIPREALGKEEVAGG